MVCHKVISELPYVPKYRLCWNFCGTGPWLQHPTQSTPGVVSERFLPPILISQVKILQCKCQYWKKLVPFSHLSYSLKRTGGSLSSHADVGVVEGLLCSPHMPGGVRQGQQQEMVLVLSSFWQEKCCSDVDEGQVGGSPWLVRKYCFYIIPFRTPAMCEK